LISYLHRAISVFLILPCTLIVFAQNNVIDSLQNILPTQRDDTNKVNTLNAISREFNSKMDYKSALEYAERALSLSGKIAYKKGMGNAYLSIGSNYEEQGLYTYALNNFYTALKLYQELGEKKDIAHTYSWIGYHYNEQELYQDAFNNYDTALKLYQATGDKKEIAFSYTNIGRTYAELGNYGEAISNEYKALELYEELGDKLEEADLLQFFGATYQEQGNYSEALNKYKASLKLRQEIGFKLSIAQSYTSIGEMYTALGNYTEALQNDSAALKILKGTGYEGKDFTAFCFETFGLNYEKMGEIASKNGNRHEASKLFNKSLENFQASLKIWEEKGLKGSIAELNIKVGFALVKLNDFAKAKIFFQKGLQIATIVADKEIFKECYQDLSILDSIEGNYEQAYEHYKLYILYRDSLINDETTKKSLQAKMQYESDKKEVIAKALQYKKDVETKRIKNLQYFAIGALIVLAIVILLIASIQWRNNKHKQRANFLLQQQKEKVENTLTELKSTQSQLIQSEKMASLGELTAGIAHEIQNPLNFINNFSEVNKELLEELKSERIKSNTISDGSLEDGIINDVIANEEKINHHGKRADAIVKGMLQHSRSNSGFKELTEINALADEYLRLAYHGLRAKDKDFNATINTDFDKTIGNINIIPQDIGRVLLNLYNNAFYAVSEKKKSVDAGYEPTVSASTKKLDSKITISVKDNGNGIPQKVVDKIFQPFFTTKPTGQGTGLGLSLSYDIVKTHGGEIKVETKVGEGTEFQVQLPISG
jgi:two-component system, NtrC family, sensor kinase